MTATPRSESTATMTVVEYDGAGGPEVLRVQQRPIPEPAEGEVLIRVHAAGINNADLLQRAGKYPVPPGVTDVPGLEVSGTVEESGAGVGHWDFGTPVCALLAGGGYAEYVAVPAGQILPAPDGVSLTEAAGLPEVAATCWSNLVMRAGVQPGDRVLVHGGTGGIGSFALQLLTSLGARPLATAGSAEKVARCIELGAEHAFNYREQDFVERVREMTEGHGADIVLDVVGAAYLESNVEVLAPGGRLVTIGLQGGVKGTLNMGALMGKGAWATGSTLRSQPEEMKARILQPMREHVWPLVASGTISAGVDRVFPLAEVDQAQEYFGHSERTGKVLLVPDPADA